MCAGDVVRDASLFANIFFPSSFFLCVSGMTWVLPQANNRPSFRIERKFPWDGQIPQPSSCLLPIFPFRLHLFFLLESVGCPNPRLSPDRLSRYPPGEEHPPAQGLHCCFHPHTDRRMGKGQPLLVAGNCAPFFPRERGGGGSFRQACSAFHPSGLDEPISA